MRFAIVRPRDARTDLVDVATFEAALLQAGLDPKNIDHGVVSRPSVIGKNGIAVAVDQDSLFVPVLEQRYFRIAGYGNLLAGNAVLYAFDGAGATVDLERPPNHTYLPTQHLVERAIKSGLIVPPIIGFEMGTTRKIIWRWPAPKPTDTEREAMIAEMGREPITIVDGDTFIVAVKDRT